MTEHNTNLLETFVAALNKDISNDNSTSYEAARSNKTGLYIALKLCTSAESISFGLSHMDDTWSYIDYRTLDEEYGYDDCYVLNVEFSVDVYRDVFDMESSSDIMKTISEMTREQKIHTIFRMIETKKTRLVKQLGKVIRNNDCMI